MLEGGCRDERYGESGRERERETESIGEMDHPVSGCIMRGKTEAKVWDEIWRLLRTHKRQKDTKVLRLRVYGFYPGGHHSAYGCITPMTFAWAHQ